MPFKSWYGATMNDPKQPQLNKFKEAAREHDADESEAHWDERLKKVASHKPSPEAGKPEQP